MTKRQAILGPGWQGSRLDIGAAAMAELDWGTYPIPSTLYQDMHKLSIGSGTPPRHGDLTFHDRTHYGAPPNPASDECNQLSFFANTRQRWNLMTDRSSVYLHHYADNVIVARRKCGPPVRAAPVTYGSRQGADHSKSVDKQERRLSSHI